MGERTMKSIAYISQPLRIRKPASGSHDLSFAMHLVLLSRSPLSLPSRVVHKGELRDGRPKGSAPLPVLLRHLTIYIVENLKFSYN